MATNTLLKLHTFTLSNGANVLNLSVGTIELFTKKL
jgi:hypothetical protein